MSTLFQPGQHPDADQLNAFVEHALPLHEQQATLAHLAACADCRAIVYLAQSAVLEVPAQPQPVAAPRPWFSSWMLAFPAAAALACLIFLTVHLRNATISTNPVAGVDSRLLKPIPPPPPQAPPPEPAASTKPAPAPVRTPHAVAEPHASGIAKEPEMAIAANAPLENKSFHGAMTGASYAPVPPPPAAAAPAPADTITTAAPPQLAGIGGSAPRRELRSAASQYDTGRAQAQQAPPLPPPAPASANSGIYGGTGQTNLNENYIEGVPASSASAQAVTGSAADTVTVDALSVNASEAEVAQKRLPALPSKLAALSVAINARRQLAVDTAGTLFRSEDSGSTWQPIPVQWTGRAIKVALVPSPSAHLLGKTAGALSAPSPAAKAAAASSLQPPTFELTTDAGDRWISTDGQTWTRK